MEDSFVIGVTCLAPSYNVTLPDGSNFNVNLTGGDRPCEASATSTGLHPKYSALPF